MKFRPGEALFFFRSKKKKELASNLQNESSATLLFSKMRPCALAHQLSADNEKITLVFRAFLKAHWTIM